MRAAGEPAWKIAREFGVTTARISQVVQVYDLPRSRKRSGAGVGADVAAQVRTLLAQGMGAAEIGDRVQVRAARPAGGVEGAEEAGSVGASLRTLGALGSTRASSPPAVRQGPWVDRAMCAGAPLGWFFSEDPTCVRVGKALCAVCPVRAECLGWALGTGRSVCGAG